MDRSDFQGELAAVIAGTRREFWSPTNLKAYGDEAPAGDFCGASGGPKNANGKEGGQPTESWGKGPKENHLSGNNSRNYQSDEATVGSRSPQQIEVLEETTSLSSGGESEDETPMTELDLLVQKYDRRLKQLHPVENQTEQQKRRDIARQKSRKYKCEACGKGFTRRGDLNEHVLIHGDDRKFSCDICDKSFKQSQGLSQHMKVHDSKLSYDCHVCDYSSKRKDVLKEHLKLHSEKAEYKCDRCPKAYKQRAALRDHRLVHIFEIPFRCKKCDCGFKTEARLKAHRMVHEDTREFKCEVCSKAFKFSGNLKQHSVVHSNEKLFPCDKCSKEFKGKTSLKRHERSHTGEKPFICCDCTKAFTQSSHLNRHRRVCPKLDFRVKDLPEVDFSSPNGNLIETFASTIYADNDEGNSGFITLNTEGAEDAPPGVDDLDGTYTGRVIEVARSSSCT